MKVKNIYPIQKCLNGKHIRDLSDIELLAITIGVGSKIESVYSLATRIYYELAGLRGIYASSVKQLSSINGIGVVKSIKILSALEMGRRIIAESSHGQELSSPERVWRCVLDDIVGVESELFLVLILNSKNQIIKKQIVSRGTVSETLVHPREVFRKAIQENGSAIIVCHNHPSGDTMPSQHDIKVTERLYKASRIIGIEMLDHIIVTEENYYSMREQGYLTDCSLNSTG